MGLTAITTFAKEPFYYQDLNAEIANLLANAIGLEGSTTHNLGSLADGASETFSITVTGAALGDYPMVSRGATIDAGMETTCAITAADTVSVTVTNKTGGTVDAASATYYARVFPRT